MKDLQKHLNESELVSAWMFANTPGYLFRSLSSADAIAQLARWLRSDRRKRTQQAVSYLKKYLKAPLSGKKTDPTPWGAAALIVAMGSTGMPPGARAVVGKIAKGKGMGNVQHLLHGLAQRVLADLRDTQERTIEVKPDIKSAVNSRSERSSVIVVEN